VDIEKANNVIIISFLEEWRNEADKQVVYNAGAEINGWRGFRIALFKLAVRKPRHPNSRTRKKIDRFAVKK